MNHLDFDKCSTCSFGFDIALHLLKKNIAVTRIGWLSDGIIIKAQYPDKNSKMNEPYLYVEYHDKRRFPWNPDQSDLMGNDWMEVFPQ